VWNLAFAQGTGTPANAPAPGTGTPGPGGLFANPFIFLAIFIAIFYFLLIRPNQKRERERRNMLEALAKGDRVITSGGIVGTIVGLSEKTAVLRVSDEPPVKVEFVRGAISRVVTREENVE
jgi:preprotein translocase subunit YajC